jgi:phosphatidylglycerophosphate synthase
MTAAKRAPLDVWTAAHSVAMLVFTAAALLFRDARWAAVAGASSLGIFTAIERGRWTPRGSFGWANGVTAVRVLLVVGLSEPNLPGSACSLLVALAFALDGVDGFLARRQGTASVFGARFDMECDALLVLVAGVVVAISGRLGPWIVLPGALRYLYALAVVVVPTNHGEEPRSRIGRSAFAVMVVSLVASLWPSNPVQFPLAVAATSLILYSFARSTVWSFASRRVAGFLLGQTR